MWMPCIQHVLGCTCITRQAPDFWVGANNFEVLRTDFVLSALLGRFQILLELPQSLRFLVAISVHISCTGSLVCTCIIFCC